MSSKPVTSLAVATALVCGMMASAHGQPAGDQENGAHGPDPLVILFPHGSSALQPGATVILDRASRAYSEGKPVVMILTGSSDRIGSPQRNLDLSQKRANAVLQGLISRGIPADRFQILAKGESEPPVSTPEHTSEPRNRSVAITWR